MDNKPREKKTKFIERFQVNEIVNSITSLVKGDIIFPPVYDPILRKNQGLSEPIQIKSGILIIEGVIALTIQELLEIANLNIYVSIPDFTRLKRSIQFY